MRVRSGAISGKQLAATPVLYIYVFFFSYQVAGSPVTQDPVVTWHAVSSRYGRGPRGDARMEVKVTKRSGELIKNACQKL